MLLRPVCLRTYSMCVNMRRSKVDIALHILHSYVYVERDYMVEINTPLLVYVFVLVGYLLASGITCVSPSEFCRFLYCR